MDFVDEGVALGLVLEVVVLLVAVLEVLVDVRVLRQIIILLVKSLGSVGHAELLDLDRIRLLHVARAVVTYYSLLAGILLDAWALELITLVMLLVVQSGIGGVGWVRTRHLQLHLIH